MEGAAGLVAASACLGVVHHGLLPGTAVAIAGAATLAAWVLRPTWAGLPGFVDRWLGVGVAVTAAGALSAVHALSYGIPYAVLRLAELASVLSASTALGLAVAALAHTHLRLADEVAAQQQALARLQQRALESRLSALSAQINPHFLFNTLNTLAEVVHEDEDLAEDLITDLAAMMRYALRSSTTRVPLAEELAMVRRLLHLESARLGDRLDWRVDDAPAPPHPQVSVPGLLVQALVENAVRHGVAPRVEGGRVEVRVEPVDGAVQVVVHDDGPGLPDDVAASLAEATPPERGTAGAGGGLWNTAERLRLTWPDRATLEVAGPPGTTLTLTLPADEAPR